MSVLFVRKVVVVEVDGPLGSSIWPGTSSRTNVPELLFRSWTLAPGWPFKADLFCSTSRIFWSNKDFSDLAFASRLFIISKFCLGIWSINLVFFFAIRSPSGGTIFFGHRLSFVCLIKPFLYVNLVPHSEHEYAFSPCKWCLKTNLSRLFPTYRVFSSVLIQLLLGFTCESALRARIRPLPSVVHQMLF